VVWCGVVWCVGGGGGGLSRVAQTPPTAMVLIDKTTVLRAAAFRDNYVPTNIDAQTYLFVDDIVLQDAQATLAAVRIPAMAPTMSGID